MKYFARLFSSRGFQAAPLLTIFYGIQLAVLIALKRGTKIAIKFGSASFLFNYIHGKRYGGGRGIFLYRNRIEDLMAYGDRFIRTGDIVIDGGANQGVFTTAFAKYVAPAGRVIAVEPMDYAVKRVQENMKTNGLESIVTVANAALSDVVETVSLDLGRGVGSASITNDYGSDEKIDVQTTTIDLIVERNQLPRVDFIKLDIEGAEMKALLGAKNTIENFHPTFCLEISVGSGSDIERAAHFHLLEIGYTPYEFQDGEMVKLEDLNPPHVNIFYLYH